MEDSVMKVKDNIYVISVDVAERGIEIGKRDMAAFLEENHI